MGNCGGSPSPAPRKPAPAAPKAAPKPTQPKTEPSKLKNGETRVRTDMPIVKELTSTIGRSKGSGGRLSVAPSDAPNSSRYPGMTGPQSGRSSPTQDGNYDRDSSAGARSFSRKPSQQPSEPNIAVTRASNSDDDMDATWKYKNTNNLHDDRQSNTSSANREISPVGSEDPSMFRINSYRSIGENEQFEFIPRQQSMDGSFYSPMMSSSFGSMNRGVSVASSSSFRNEFSQSSRQLSVGSGGFRDRWSDLDRAYDSLDQGHYETAFRKLKEIKRSGDVPEQMVAALGLTLLQGLGPTSWSQTHAFPDCEKEDVNTARKWLHERLQSRRNRTASTALALADIGKAMGYYEEENMFRELSVKTKNPLALLRFAIGKSQQIRHAPPNFPAKQLEMEKQQCVNILADLSKGEDRIAAKAGTYIWVSVYHGIDGRQQDTQKAIDLLTKAIKYEMGKGDGGEFKFHMSRLQEKQFRNSSSFYNRPDLQYEGGLSSSSRDLRSTATANRRQSGNSTPRSLFEKHRPQLSPSRRTSSMPGTPTNGPLPPRHPSINNGGSKRAGSTGSNLKDPHHSYRSPPSARSQSSDAYGHRDSFGGNHSNRGMRRIDSVNSAAETIVELQGENGITYGQLRPQRRESQRSRKVAVSDPNKEYGDDLDEDGNYDYEVANSDVASTNRSMRGKQERGSGSYRSIMRQQQERNGSSNEIQALYRSYNRKGSRGGRPASEAGTIH